MILKYSLCILVLFSSFIGSGNLILCLEKDGNSNIELAQGAGGCVTCCDNGDDNRVGLSEDDCVDLPLSGSNYFLSSIKKAEPKAPLLFSTNLFSLYLVNFSPLPLELVYDSNLDRDLRFKSQLYFEKKVPLLI